jgi:hypothetical protein
MRSTALLVMDVQQGIVDHFAADDGYLSRLACVRPLTWTTGLPSWLTGAWTPTPRCTGS